MINKTFADKYAGLRKKEGRVYSDTEVLNLPSIHSSHTFYKEWMIRKRSCKKLLRYIRKKGGVQNILEVGCGNGWLSAQLATNTGATVVGLDINDIELEQARRLFSPFQNLGFINGDMGDEIFADKKFDSIVFAASIQYFESIKKIVAIALEHLTPQGEVHIMDTNFYQGSEVILAQQRTKEYYASLGFSGMEEYYFHHTLNELNVFQYKILFNPASWRNKWLFNKPPFYWIVIKKRNH
ncbi:MAG TPA: class I SAM-dependent methyltransferase [Ferruginibacter sp.]|nr:class I SAM-dependent methyltransferase [Ferruginibacter sp.]